MSLAHLNAALKADKLPIKGGALHMLHIICFRAGSGKRTKSGKLLKLGEWKATDKMLMRMMHMKLTSRTTIRRWRSRLKKVGVLDWDIVQSHHGMKGTYPVHIYTVNLETLLESCTQKVCIGMHSKGVHDKGGHALKSSAQIGTTSSKGASSSIDFDVRSSLTGQSTTKNQQGSGQAADTLRSAAPAASAESLTSQKIYDRDYKHKYESYEAFLSKVKQGFEFLFNNALNEFKDNNLYEKLRVTLSDREAEGLVETMRSEDTLRGASGHDDLDPYIRFGARVEPLSQAYGCLEWALKVPYWKKHIWENPHQDTPMQAFLFALQSKKDKSLLCQWTAWVKKNIEYKGIEHPADLIITGSWEHWRCASCRTDAHGVYGCPDQQSSVPDLNTVDPDMDEETITVPAFRTDDI